LHPAELDALHRKLIELASELTANSPTRLDAHVAWGSRALYGEAARRYFALVGDMANEARWSSRFSETYLDNLLSEVLLKIDKEGGLAGHVLLRATIEKLEDFAVKQIVYLPVHGFYLSDVPQLEVGQVVFRAFNASDIQAIEDRYSDRPETPDPDAQSYFRGRLDEHLGERMTAIVNTTAEPNRAYEIAEAETRYALEILMFGNAAGSRWSPFANAVMGFDDPGPGKMSYLAFDSDGGLNWHGRRLPSRWSVEIGPPQIEALENVGAFVASELRKKAYGDLTDLDKSLLQAIHWFSASVFQQEAGAKTLFLVTSLEALLGPKDRTAISSTVAEALAMLSSDSLEERLALKKFVRRMYDSRSSITHGGHRHISEAELRSLRWVVGSVITRLLQVRHRVRTKDELAAILERARLDAAHLAFPDLRETPKPLSVLREERGMLAAEVADRAGCLEESIAAWERGAATPDLIDLRRLSMALGCSMFDIELPENYRLVDVRGHRFMLRARRIDAGHVTVDTQGWDYWDADAFPVRPLESAYRGSASPIALADRRHFATGYTRRMALDVAEAKLRALLERGLCRDRIEGDLLGWAPPPVPEHWRRHLKARKTVEQQPKIPTRWRSKTESCS